MVRLFGVHAAISLIPVLVLGGALLLNFRSEAQRRAFNEAQDQAELVAETAIQPLLDGQSLTKPVAGAELTALNDQLKRGVAENNISVRLLPSLDAPATAAYTYGTPAPAPPDASDQLHDTVSKNNATVTVYRPLTATPAGAEKAQPVGFLELSLPYGPIRSHVDAALASQNRELAVALGALYLTLIVISISMSRGLRKEVAFNAFLAEHDNLTDLPNRTLFHRRAASALKRASRGQPIAIAIIDLDRFKDVNDTLGHHNGDRLLTELSRRLDVNTRPEDTVARLGGDEFGVILTGANDPEEALWRLRDIIDREVEVSGLPLSVESSVGFVVAPDDGNDVDDLLQRADVAMYVAKGAHSGVVRYDPEQDDYDAAKLGLIAELRHAIDAGQLVLHYQPKASISTGQVEAMEALVRWEHPARGLVYPDSFVPIAEQTDLIDRLTDWALDTALADLRELSALNSKLAVAVNVSARSLSKPDFALRVQAALAKADIPATRLIIEITETALISDPERAGAALANLDAAGVRVSIDDFGQGQTSLGYLSNLPVHELKIDKSFVYDMLTNPAHAAIVRSIVDLGHNLHMRVVGEGVETEEVLAGLGNAGCDVAQGFLLARPMAITKLELWLQERGQTDKRPRRRPLTAKRRVPVG
ncbi:MAG: bifunctional diguanylate cyclase/phosphodiesterase [Actinobacteria bacterium]|nr:MAG: bifunctional diguanylate cyclase/phosphodiesterase [Actinomycetota bacterium]